MLGLLMSWWNITCGNLTSIIFLHENIKRFFVFWLMFNLMHFCCCLHLFDLLLIFNFWLNINGKIKYFCCCCVHMFEVMSHFRWFIIQGMPLNKITLGHTITDPMNRMLTITKFISYINYAIERKIWTCLIWVSITPLTQ